MSGADVTYSFAAVAKILDVPENKLRYWSQIGFVGPSLRKGAKQLFSFQDLISVKAAKELVDRGVKVADIRKALVKVRDTLPNVDRPLDRLRVAFDGSALVVVEDGSAFEVSGQRLFDFRLSDLAGQAVPARNGGESPATPLLAAGLAAITDDGAASATEEPRGRDPAQPATAFGWFLRGLAEEDAGRLAEAERAMREALKMDSGLAAAHTNLGRLAHRRGDPSSARAAFEAALALDPEQPEARFNLANLILESGDFELAAAELRRVILVAPDFADAHFNLAVALERLGGRAQARAHLERFLQLATPEVDSPGAADAAPEHASVIASARSLMDRLAE